MTKPLTFGEAYAHPVGRDAVDQLLRAVGISSKWVDNPVVSRLPLSWLARLTGREQGAELLASIEALLAPQRPGDGEPANAWWQEAVFYQVYPRSFADSNGDGIGDLTGIIEHLDHLVDLGVDCLWLSPIFASPNKDMGYDISDYRDIMTEMGTLADADRLIAACHERGLRLILDLVVNHTSDQHPWFQAALADPDGEYGNYYVLRDGEPDTPPNNWISFFSGPTWRWFPEINRWGLHLFAAEQLDLNWENPAVRREVAEVAQWWLARGVDGFRLDVINFISKRDGLPDGNQLIGQTMGFRGVEQYFHGPHVHNYLAELRRDGFTRADVAPGTEGLGEDATAFMVGEMPGIGMETGKLFTNTGRGELDLIFGFDHLETPGHVRWDDYRYDLNRLKDYLIDYQSRLGPGDWLSLFFENHDNPRMISKINPEPRWRSHLGKLLATLQLTMRGTPFLYQGQEIAAINQDFPTIDEMRDVESLNRYAELTAAGKDGFAGVIAGSRDHARTPMRWEDSPGLGFTTGQPWLAGHETSAGFTVAEQRADEHSVLNWYRLLIQLRRANPALTKGSIDFVDPGRKNYFAWYRRLGEEAWLIELNLSDRELKRPLTDATATVVLGTAAKRAATMAPYEALVCRAAKS